jgi:hypothetical protein
MALLLTLRHRPGVSCALPTSSVQIDAATNAPD